eukprot:610444-Prorocentrum_minimum.AAC.1
MSERMSRGAGTIRTRSGPRGPRGQPRSKAADRPIDSPTGLDRAMLATMRRRAAAGEGGLGGRVARRSPTGPPTT